MLNYAGLSKEDLETYDYFIVAFSGGKDSIACFLHLLDCGVPKSKIELWHHSIDGRGNDFFMDWPITESYCEELAKAFNVPIFFSWKEGGFKGEMLRENQPTAKTTFEIPNDDNLLECGLETKSIGGKGKPNTRLKFPQVTTDLRTRWCSAYLKIGVCTSALSNQERFQNKRTLVITGERAEESAARSKYKEFEPDPADLRNGRKPRHIDRARPVHKWLEQDVWNIIKKYKINMHPAYRLGWGRLSCMACIFGSKNQWSSVKEIAPKAFGEISEYEQLFETTIQRKDSVEELAEKGTPYNFDPELAKYSQKRYFTESIFMDKWSLPMGAFGEQNGSI
ncbi:phosphoadenosine phosphosulfate reductase family protein [Candidatus Pacearchaeota archaeon]|nr:phosphoadenosine phosphosulfate reductase family protein [Candidatus Pacearchaeota archaeon]